MTNLTPIYWDWNGVSLNTPKWSVTTFGGNRHSVPQRRGENLQLPFRPGRVRMKKYRDQRVLDLPMWLAPCDNNGVEDPDRTPEQRMHENWYDLMELLDTEDESLLTKRWYNADGDVEAATGLAELADATQPSWVADGTLSFTVSLAMADPYFYAPPTAAVAVGAINVAGTAPTDKITLTMGNGRVTFPDGNWIQYNGTGTAVLNFRDMTALKAGVYVNGLLTRNVDFPSWPVLQKGANVLVGNGTISYQAAFK